MARVQNSNEIAIKSNYDASEGTSPSSSFADSELRAEPIRMDDDKLAFDWGSQPRSITVTAHAIYSIRFLTEWNVFSSDLSTRTCFERMLTKRSGTVVSVWKYAP